MVEGNVTREALKTLNTIKGAIDRTTGAQSMLKFVWKTGWVFSLFGIAILLGGVISMKVLMKNSGIYPDLFYECWLGYFCLLVFIGFAYFWFQLEKMDHARMIRSYVQLYLSLDSFMFIILVFLLYKHMVVYVIPFWVIIIGITIVVLSATTFIKALMYVGYELIIIGTFGLFFVEHHFLTFTCISLGLNPLLIGVYLNVKHTSASKMEKRASSPANKV
jgi:hypothetical protein